MSKLAIKVATCQFALVLLIFLATGVLSASEDRLNTFRETFDAEDGPVPGGWKASSGNWKIKDESLLVDSLDEESFIWFGDESWQNYVIKATATFAEVRNDRRWLAVLFRGTKDGAQPWSQFTVRFRSTISDGTEFAVKKDNGWKVRRMNAASQNSVFGKAHKLRVEVRGSRVKAYLDGELVIESHFCIERNTGCVGLGVSGCLAKFDDFSVKPIGGQMSEYKRKNPNPCKAIAHRGFSFIAPENTLAAIKKAIQTKVGYCEFDVRKCSDGTVVVIHDETVDRTTDGKGKISELSYDQINKLDAGSWKNNVYAGEPIPRLNDVLGIFNGTECIAVIELKDNEIYRDVSKIVNELSMNKQVCAVSFDPQVLRNLNLETSTINCGLLLGYNSLNDLDFSSNRIVQKARVCHANCVSIEYSALSPKLIEKIQKQGITVWAWTVNDPDVMVALINWGIDGVVTDRPDILLQVRENL